MPIYTKFIHFCGKLMQIYVNEIHNLFLWRKHYGMAQTLPTSNARDTKCREPSETVSIKIIKPNYINGIIAE